MYKLIFPPSISISVVQYKITYSIANANNAGSEDSQYVKITGSEGEIEEQECESADFDNRGDDAECFIESDINIGDYGCVHLRTGGRNGLDLSKVWWTTFAQAIPGPICLPH